MKTVTPSEFELIDGKYGLKKELGAGAFGSVYLATQFVLGKPLRNVALKLFKSEVINSENVVDQFKDALVILDLLSDLTDWNIRQHFITVYDLGLTQEKTSRGFVSMELVKGGNLHKRIQKVKRFTLQGTRHYLKQLLKSLAFMHRQEFVHSDLKPENILVFSGQGEDLIKIGDFGLAGHYQGPMGGGGPRGGTMSYLALEALYGINTTPGCDVYSLGLMAYEMLMGENPYNRVAQHLSEEELKDNERVNQLHREARERTPLKLNRGDFPELTGSHPDPVLGGMVDLINQMLENSPEKRCSSAQTAWEKMQESEGISPVPSPSRPNRGSLGTSSRGQEDPELAALIRKCESAITLGRWSDAGECANKLIKNAPQSAEGHLLKSKMFLEQAKHFEANGNRAGVVRSLQKQACTTLQKALNQCTGEDQQAIRFELANIFRKQGDNVAAEELLKGGRRA